VHYPVSSEFRFDRYRPALKETWKDEPLPAAGQTYDLGTHVIDQALATFGRPQKITAFIENLRGIGSPEVDDSVRTLNFVSVRFL
jgi:predicted dehydrogenase